MAEVGAGETADMNKGAGETAIVEKGGKGKKKEGEPASGEPGNAGGMSDSLKSALADKISNLQEKKNEDERVLSASSRTPAHEAMPPFGAYAQSPAALCFLLRTNESQLKIDFLKWHPRYWHAPRTIPACTPHWRALSIPRRRALPAAANFILPLPAD